MAGIRRKNWIEVTNEIKEVLKEEYNNGAPIYELAAKYDIPEAVIRNLLGKKD